MSCKLRISSIDDLLSLPDSLFTFIRIMQRRFARQGANSPRYCLSGFLSRQVEVIFECTYDGSCSENEYTIAEVNSLSLIKTIRYRSQSLFDDFDSSWKCILTHLVAQLAHSGCSQHLISPLIREK